MAHVKRISHARARVFPLLFARYVHASHIHRTRRIQRSAVTQQHLNHHPIRIIYVGLASYQRVVHMWSHFRRLSQTAFHFGG